LWPATRRRRRARAASGNTDARSCRTRQEIEMIVVRGGQVADLAIDAVAGGIGDVGGQEHRPLAAPEQLARQLADQCRSVIAPAVLKRRENGRDASDICPSVAVS